MPTRDFDWIVRPSDGTSPGGTWTDPRAGAAWSNLVGNSILLTSLALPATVKADSPQHFETNENWTLESIRGHITWMIDPAEISTYWGALRVVIMVLPVSPAGTPWVLSSFDLNDVDVANRDIIWSNHEIAFRQAPWLGTEITMSQFMWKWELHTKARRRIEAGYAPVMVIQWESRDTLTPGPMPRLNWFSTFRVLGSKRM